ncbi:MAG: hypothetical protein FJX76_14610, partial [Armatimonadetes bacterium]|nr:hypothetical protein [Armatimonadota bacterium]
MSKEQPKMRVYELAKEMGYSAKEFLDMLQKMGVHAKGNFSVLEDPTVETIKKTVKPRGEGKPAEKAPEDAPTPQAVVEEEKPAPVREVRRITGPTGTTMVTTIDPQAAA